MKKFTVILLWAALALPMMAQTAKKGQTAIVDKASIEQVAGRPLAIFDGNVKTAFGIKADAQVVYENSFETDAEIAQWAVVDNDGDGYNWEIDDYYANTGNQSLTSRSYYGGTALSPDNWLISPKVPLGGAVKFFAMNYLSSYPDVFAVYVCEGDPTSVDDFVKISGNEDIAPPTAWQEYEFDLSAYAGKEGCIAIRHYNSVDQFRLFIDDFSVLAPAAALPQNVTVSEVTATTAKVTWDNEENVAWNLRYRPVVEQPAVTYWDFESGDLGWTVVDADGDTKTWFLWDPISFGYDAGDGERLFGTKCASSASYDNSGALTPDNWMISPKVTLTGNLSFWAAGQDPDYAAENFAVYVSVGDPSDLSSFVKLGDDIVAESPIKQYTFSLADYEGQEGYVAFRHYNISDMFRLNIDNVLIGESIPEPVSEPEWQYVNGVEETQKVLEGLTPETTYEVQVQGIDEAKGLSAWTESVIFTTLAEGQEPEEVKYYITGGFNGWNADDPDELTEEGYTFTAVDNGGQFDLDFKLLTAGENDWIWIGGIDENNVGCFAITEELMTSATEISLYDDGANFRLPAAGTYTVTLVREEGAKGLIEGAKIVVTKENDPVNVGVNDINAKAVAGVKYYNLAGVESNKPFDGVNVMVTTYTDGTKAAAKVIK